MGKQMGFYPFNMQQAFIQYNLYSDSPSQWRLNMSFDQVHIHLRLLIKIKLLPPVNALLALLVNTNCCGWIHVRNVNLEVNGAPA